MRSLERFCSERGLHKTSRLSAREVDAAVSDAVAKVGFVLVIRTMGRHILYHIIATDKILTRIMPYSSK